jgi:hypothetical protein
MKYCILFVLLIITLSASSQTTDAVLNKRLSEYLGFSKNLEIENLLTYMYPRIFELATKAQIKQALESAYNSTEIEIKLDSMGIGNVLPISKFSKGLYTKFGYGVKLTMKFLDKEMEDKIDIVLQSLKTKFGELNVQYAEESKIFTVYQEKEALAIKDNYSKNIWTILGLEADKTLLKIIPAEIRNKYSL